MSHGVRLAAILDYVIRELRKFIIFIIEPGDIERQHLCVSCKYEEYIKKVITAFLPKIKQKHVFSYPKSSQIFKKY